MEEFKMYLIKNNKYKKYYEELLNDSKDEIGFMHRCYNTIKIHEYDFTYPKKPIYPHGQFYFSKNNEENSVSIDLCKKYKDDISMKDLMDLIMNYIKYKFKVMNEYDNCNKIKYTIYINLFYSCIEMSMNNFVNKTYPIDIYIEEDMCGFATQTDEYKRAYFAYKWLSFDAINKCYRKLFDFTYYGLSKFFNISRNVYMDYIENNIIKRKSISFNSKGEPIKYIYYTCDLKEIDFDNITIKPHKTKNPIKSNKPKRETNTYYIVYLITDNTNGMKYIGKHKTKDLNDGYMGSGRLLKQNQEVKGIDKFTKEILHLCKNEEHMAEMERMEIEKVKAYENDKYYNLI